MALLVAQGYDPGAIAWDLQIKRFDVYQLLDATTARLRQAETANPTSAPVPPPVQRPDIPPKPPTLIGEHRQEPENIEEEPADFTRSDQSGRTSVGRGRGRRHCRRCGQAGHNINGCDLDESDLAAARLQDIAAACVRIGLTPAPPPRAPLPVREQEPPTPIVVLPTWDREDLDAIAAMTPEAPEPPPAPQLPEPPPEERLVRVSEIKDRHRARTIRSPYRLTRDEKRVGEEIEIPSEIEKPLTRAECQQDTGRPCPWVRCKAHLYLEVNPETGSIKLNFPHLEVWEMAETCSLDVADRGSHTLEEVGALVNLTRERVRQIEVRAGENREAKKIAEDVEFIEHDDGSPLASAIG